MFILNSFHSNGEKMFAKLPGRLRHLFIFEINYEDSFITRLFYQKLYRINCFKLKLFRLPCYHQFVTTDSSYLLYIGRWGFIGLSSQLYHNAYSLCLHLYWIQHNMKIYNILRQHTLYNNTIYTIECRIPGNSRSKLPWYNLLD